jgi:AraC family transcriptional regulator of adaptative response / methylphosphotriester-DNA alkyltransferase methyltransferase
VAEVLTDQMWQAIVQCDSSFDKAFYYGVSTTGIFCRPSCKSRTPNREHVRVFRASGEALSQQYRPCKRCRPDGLRLPDEEWTARIADWILSHLVETVTLERLAEEFHASPFHLQRIFKKMTGVTPAVYAQRERMEKAKLMLASPELTVADVGMSVGIPSAAHFSTLFKKATGQTPSQYRSVWNEKEG